jgi:predicted oxidoreductase
VICGPDGTLELARKSGTHMALKPTPAGLSPIVAGLWRALEWGLDTAALARWIEEALALGISSFDHADIYGDYQVEARFGDALASSLGLRQRLQIVTKCGIKPVSAQRRGRLVNHYDSSRAHVLASVDASLKALRTDRIDLLLMHRPDLLMQPEELADTFRQLLAAGKVLHFGVSNHTPGQFDMLRKRHHLVTNQIEFSPLQMQALADGALEQALDLGLRPMVWSPLAQGQMLTGQTPQAQRVHQVLTELGAPRGASVATMAYAWILRHPAQPLPITGTSRIAALREAVAALDVPMNNEDWYRVWQASMGHSVA